MAKGVNKVFLLGNVGKDPEIRATAGGMTIASFTLATADRAKDQQGNWADKTEWHNLVAFQRTAEIVRDYVKKGTQVFVEGKIQTRSWDDKESGQKKYRTEILVNELSAPRQARAQRRRRRSSSYCQVLLHQLRQRQQRRNLPASPTTPTRASPTTTSLSNASRIAQSDSQTHKRGLGKRIQRLS